MITRSVLNTRYTPEDVYTFAGDGNANKLIIALNQGGNSTNWFSDDYLGNTAGHIAIENDNMNCVEILLDNGFDVNSKNNADNTSLHYAAWNDRQSDVNSKNSYGITLLHYAALYDRINIVEILLNRGVIIIIIIIIIITIIIIIIIIIIIKTKIVNNKLVLVLSLHVLISSKLMSL